MKINRTIFCILLIAVSGCLVEGAVNPVKAWNILYSGDCVYAALVPKPDEIFLHKYKVILDDYQDFYKRTTQEHPSWDFSSMQFCEDKTGRHAIKVSIETGPRDYTDFFLMYNKSDMRTKIIKGSTERAFHI
jgi:hypothetical protein